MGDLLSQLAASDRRVLERLSQRGQAWIVGGWVRDRLQGLYPTEMDIATNLHPDIVSQLFDKTIPVGAAFGTILVLDEESDKSWEVTTLRCDGTYGDGRRPDDVEFGDDIIEDLARRDFTINAMAVDPVTGEIIDEFGGLEDLNAGIIRAVGNSHDRIREDGLRIMRAFRFLDSGELGTRDLDDDLQVAISENLHMLEKVSSERKWAELSRILQGVNKIEIIGLMQKFGVLSRVIPETNFSSVGRLSSSPLVNLAILCSKDNRTGIELANHLKKTLRLSNEEASTIRFLHDLQISDLSLEISSLRRFNAACSDSMREEVKQYFGELGSEFIEASSNIEPQKAGNKPLIDGERLMDVTGLEAGVRLGRLKGWLHRRQIEENLSEADEVISMLDTLDWESEDPESWPALAWP
jgi:tRNA nucleotidyltransferase/poly(A) polymerase